MDERDFLQLNGIQHFYYCPRQWALIELEQTWAENAATAEGQLVHERVDDPFYLESRGALRITRSVPVASYTLGLSGVCDVIEWRRHDAGIAIPATDGHWMPTIIEYKRGKPKHNHCDDVQLCAQAIALEEMTGLRLDKAQFFYHQTRRRHTIALNDALRSETRETAAQMHAIVASATMPPAPGGTACKNCSLKELCQPRLTYKKRSVNHYIETQLQEVRP